MKTSMATATELIQTKITELKAVDSKRGLFSLSKPVKELAVYPEPFNGNAGENVYKFRDKFTKALIANQIREKDRVELLRKYLKGRAKRAVGDHYKSYKEAIDALVEHFGLPQ